MIFKFCQFARQAFAYRLLASEFIVGIVISGIVQQATAQFEVAGLSGIRIPEAPKRINLGAQINSPYSDLFPVITPDERVLFFTRKGSPQNTGYASLAEDEDIYYSMRDVTGAWTTAKKLEGPLNTASFDGVRAVNVSGTRLYLQNQYRTDGTRAKGFSVSTRQPDGTWSFPKPVEIEGYYNDTSLATMTVSADERVIVLSLKRRDTKGKRDLYVSHLQSNGTWSVPQAIVELNTAGDEMSPFIAYDDRTLYFSTDGRGGLGMHDVFITRRLDDSWQRWSAPVNLGETVNTPSFDAYFIVSARGDTAYFSSVHESSLRGFGKSDIWKVGLDAVGRADGGGVQLASLSSRNTVGTRGLDMLGRSFRLDSVLFDVDRAAIREGSLETLDRLAQLLKEYPSMTVRIEGHTDSDGDPAHNLELSNERALNVKAYLVHSGVDADRLEAIGYGETRPIAPNDAFDGKQLNRRVMVIVTGM